MDGDNAKVLLVTANVGSIFEEPTVMFPPWLRAFLQCVQDKEPGMVALHCQEVGGKNYEASMQHVNQFIKNLLACEELQRYDRARIFLDEDYTAADRFTALGNLYFIHEDIDNALIWDFVDCKFVAVEGREVLSGNIENVPLKEKAKFPQHFFPEFKWSRKGFLRTRWSINNCIFDLVNIHLFHDASNIVAMESSPSLYCGNRRRALLHTLQRFENDQYSKVPLFIFGDFNFRLDSCLLIKALTTKAVKEQTYGKKDQVNKVVYTEEGNGKVVLTVESKSFDFHDKHADLFSNTIKWLLQYDTELSSFQDRLCEHEITFPPSYPFTEEVSDGFSYMKTRVPSWCDRILLSHSAKDIISHDSCSKPEYDIIGRDTCMGDHKPVCLFLRIKPGKGKDLEDNMFEFHVKPFARRRGLSINGELVPDSEFDSFNIHDFAVFEKEQELIPEFRVSIKSRSSEPSEDKQTSSEKLSGGVDGANETNCSKAPGPSITGLEHSRSFQQIAHKVCVVERVLLRWPRRPRSRHHSSSSEDFCEETLEDSNNSDEYQQGINSEADLVAVDSVHLHLLSHDICTKEETVKMESNAGRPYNSGKFENNQVENVFDETKQLITNSFSGDINSNNEVMRELVSKDRELQGIGFGSETACETPTREPDIICEDMKNSHTKVLDLPDAQTKLKDMSNSQTVKTELMDSQVVCSLANPDCCDSTPVMHGEVVSSIVSPPTAAAGPVAAQAETVKQRETVNGQSSSATHLCPCTLL